VALCTPGGLRRRSLSSIRWKGVPKEKRNGAGAGRSYALSSMRGAERCRHAVVPQVEFGGRFHGPVPM
jgi:hypothetical protein